MNGFHVSSFCIFVSYYKKNPKQRKQYSLIRVFLSNFTIFAKSQIVANVMVKVLKKKGISASIRKVSGSVPYRVQVGTYRTKKAANKVVKKLKAAGFTVLVKNL